MTHAHWSLDCPCCRELSGRLRTPAPEKRTVQQAQEIRLSIAGLDHVYCELDSKQEECLNPVLTSPVSPNNGQHLDYGLYQQLEALSVVVQEQTATIAAQSSKLEAASYRIGYLEALVATQNETMKLLPDFSHLKNQWWHKLLSYLPHLRELADRREKMS
ncbi:MAG: hypothetical protein HY711_07645 [Candidatus Melainabacteria bacterium]|nr:hypothetical protein [Candidatus Melainabacteria bacterium]